MRSWYHLCADSKRLEVPALYRTALSVRALEEEEEDEDEDEEEAEAEEDEDEAEEEEKDEDSPWLRIACSADDACSIPSPMGLPLPHSVSSLGICFVISKYLSGGVRVARYLMCCALVKPPPTAMLWPLLTAK